MGCELQKQLYRERLSPMIRFQAPQKEMQDSMRIVVRARMLRHSLYMWLLLSEVPVRAVVTVKVQTECLICSAMAQSADESDCVSWVTPAALRRSLDRDDPTYAFRVRVLYCLLRYTQATQVQKE